MVRKQDLEDPDRDEEDDEKDDVGEDEKRAHELGHALRDRYITGMGALLARAHIKTQFLIQDALPLCGVGIIAGRPEAGKSFVAYDMALAVARGRPWLIFRNGEAVRRSDGTARPHPVLVLNYDNPESELGRRFLKMGANARDPIHIHSIGTEVHDDGLPEILKLPNEQEGLLKIIESIRPGLILIDSLRQAHTLDEVNSSDMSRIAALLRHMTQWGASVLAIHHVRKSGGGKEKERDLNAELSAEDDLRGSGEILASADVTIRVVMTNKMPGETAGTLRINKTRGWSPTMSECDYKIRDVGEDKTFVEPGGRLDTILDVIRKNGPISRRDIQRKIGGLTAAKLTEIVNLCLDFGKIREVQPSGGGTRALVIVEQTKK